MLKDHSNKKIDVDRIIRALREEFETGETPDAKYVRAMDRIPPLLHNLHGNGHSWKENKISKYSRLKSKMLSRKAF